MTIRNVTKNRAGMEDLLTGRGSESQTRAGQAVTISKVDVAFAVDTIADMQALDVSRFTRARVYSSANNYMTYAYDSTDNSGISSDTGSGTWKEVPESESVVVATDKAALRNEEPAYNFQTAFALGGSALYTGEGAAYFYDPNSAAADDGDDVLVTVAGARWIKWLGSAASGVGASYVLATGGTNNLEITLGVAAMPENQVISIRALATNTGTATLKVDALSAVNIVKVDGSNLSAGDIEAGKIYDFVLKTTGGVVIINPSINQARAEVGTDNISVPTMLRVKQHVDKRIADGDALSQAQLYSLLAAMNIEEGLKLSGDSSAQIDPGCCSSADGTAFMVLPDTLVKNLDPWVEGGTIGGGAAGGRAAGVSLTNNTWLILFMISKPDGTVDAGWDTDLNATNLLATATGYTKYRPIGLHWYWSDATIVARKTWGRFAFNIRDMGRYEQIYIIRSSITANFPPILPYSYGLFFYRVDITGGGGGGGTSGAVGGSGGTSSVDATGGILTAGGGLGGTASGSAISFRGGTADQGSDRTLLSSYGLDPGTGYGQAQGVNSRAGAFSVSHGAVGGTRPAYGAGGPTDFSVETHTKGGGSGARHRAVIRQAAGNSISFVVGAGGSVAGGAGVDAKAGQPGVIFLEI